MKSLVVFYSRTGTTKKVGELIAKNLKSDIEEIQTLKSTKGAMGYLRCGKEAMKKIPAEIKPFQKDSSKYDLVIIGTPIWGWTVSSPVRTYLMKNKFKKVAFFCTQGGSGAEKAFEEMEKICKIKPLSTLALLTKEVMQNNYEDKVKEFVKSISK